MLERDLSKTVIVLDLDDTVYPEMDYVRSGMQHVCQTLECLLSIPLKESFHTALRSGEKDWLNVLCRVAGLPASAKDSLKWLYRLHLPDIQLDPNCAKFIEHMLTEAAAVAILTDGRAITQRLKIKALGLSHLPTFVSEEYQSEKPDPVRFKVIEHAYQGCTYVYIGDNPEKDFIAGNAAGWTTIGILGSENVHSQEVSGLPDGAMPHYWVNNWNEMYKILC